MSQSLAPRFSHAVVAPHRPGLRDIVETVMREWRVRRDMRRLEELDPAQLRDIGIGPGGVEGAVRHGRHRRAAGSVQAGFEAPCTSALMPPSWTEWR